MVKKRNKKYTNIIRDRMADYYLTNREITRQYDEEHAKAKAEGGKVPWKSSEKTMLTVTLVAAMLLVLKFLILK